MTDNGARALADRIRKTGNFYGADEEAAAILANGAVFLPGPVEGAGKTRFWMDEDGTHWRSPAGAPLRDTEGPAHAVTEPAGVSRGTPMSGGAHEMAGERDVLAEALSDFMSRWDTYRADCQAARVWSTADETMYQGAEPVRAALAAPSPEPLPLDVERLARALCSDGNDEPSMWDILGEAGRNLWRNRAERIAREYAREPDRPT